jgi:dTDP-glucose 4,6-dehydratase
VRLLVTGGSGFIGSAVVRRAVGAGLDVMNVDKMTYAATKEATQSVSASPRYSTEKADVVETDVMFAIMERFRPDGIVHLAAESHVDRSIEDPLAFARTNVVGTFSMLFAASRYADSVADDQRDRFRFVHVSTDEVFGSLGSEGRFGPESPYDPRSPYSATKAGADHAVRSWGHTYGLPVVISNCSNNYGPYQFPEKLIPMMIVRAIERQPLPVFGSGHNVRDWVHVHDHATALLTMLSEGVPGSTYLVGGNEERRNIDVVRAICHILDGLIPIAGGGSYDELVTYVDDRPGHDFRYAIDPSETTRALGWEPSVGFEQGLRSTVQWYIDNQDWWRPLLVSQDATRRVGLIDRTRGGV